MKRGARLPGRAVRFPNIRQSLASALVRARQSCTCARGEAGEEIYCPYHDIKWNYGEDEVR